MSDAPAAAPSYLLLGPPDLLHDLLRDFEDIGWLTASMRWQAVVTASPEDAAAPAPDWPAEITLVGVRRDGHEAACRAYFSAE